MWMRNFYTLSLVAIGLSSAAMADEDNVVSGVPLMDTPTQQEQLGTALQTAMAQRYLEQVSIVHYMEANQGACANCDRHDEDALLTYSRSFASAQYHWRDSGSVGLSMRNGATSFGLWGDVREVNAVANEEVSLLPSGLSTSVNTVPAAVNASPGLAVNDGGNVGSVVDTPAPVARSAPSLANNSANLNVGRADASFSRAPSTQTFAGLAPNGGAARPSTSGAGPRRVQSFSTTTSDLAYKEYMGGLFVSQSF
jgi:hypothetical protein